MTTWPALVAEVPHIDCTSQRTAHGRHLCCDCDRDARIGAGIAAVRESDYRLWHSGGPGSDRDASAVAAFTEAIKPKEVEG